MLDPLRGLYIFEIKAWSYDDLKNANIQKAQNQDSTAQTLSFDNTHNIIRKKFNELTHNDGVPIYNYLIMENLSADEYQHLSDSFKELLPFDKLIFSDYQDSDIFKILQKASPEDSTLPSVDEILGTLFIQYAIIDNENSIHLASQEQINFIDKDLESVTLLNGGPRSGKTSSILLKSLISHLENPTIKIIILKPTILACDILKKKLLDIVEHAIVEADLSYIEVITPLELLNRNLQKSGKPEVTSISSIDKKLMQKSFKIADLIVCDDAGLLDDNFIDYLKHIQNKAKLLLVDEKNAQTENELTQSFKTLKCNINFIKTNPYAKALHLINNFLKNNKDENIIVISNSLTQEKLKEDLDSFITQTPEQLDSSKHLINQDFSPLLLATYADINTLSAKHIIMLDLCFTNPYEIEYALNIGSRSVSILYEEDCVEIVNLKDKYESSQE